MPKNTKRFSDPTSPSSNQALATNKLNRTAQACLVFEPANSIGLLKHALSLLPVALSRLELLKHCFDGCWLPSAPSPPAPPHACAHPP